MAAMEFNAEDREMIAVLRGVVERRGAAALANRRLLVGLLRDHLPDRARAIGLLMTAHDAGAGGDFTGRPTLEPEALEAQARSLSGETGLREDLARWAVGIWAAALTPLAPEWRDHPPVIAANGSADEQSPSALPGAVDDGGRAAAPETPAPTHEKKYALLAVLGLSLALAASAAVRLALLRNRPLANSPRIVLTHGGGTAMVVGATEDGASVVLASDSLDRADWPIIPDAGHPDGNSRNWRFTAGLKFADGRVFYYQPTMAMGADLTAGAADVRAGALSASRGRRPVSLSRSAPAIRDPSTADHLDVKFLDWRDDAADAPPICLKLTLDAAARTFEPQTFCATSVTDGGCAAQILGCGFFR